jgi:hypothetical protein
MGFYTFLLLIVFSLVFCYALLRVVNLPEKIVYGVGFVIPVIIYALSPKTPDHLEIFGIKPSK